MHIDHFLRLKEDRTDEKLGRPWLTPARGGVHGQAWAAGLKHRTGFWYLATAYSGDRDRSFRLNVTVAHEMVLRD